MHPHQYHHSTSGGVGGGAGGGTLTLHPHHGGGISSSSLGVNGGPAAGGAGGLSGGHVGVMGCGDKFIPSMMIDRPKMPRSTWDSLKAHIARERQRKKHQQQQTQEEERMKKERERKKKQEALTIEETKEEIAITETKLTQLKEEKHQLFHTLKKVLYEDDRRRSKEVSHPQVYLQPTVRGGPSSAHYMKPNHPHLLMPQQQSAVAAAAAAAAAAQHLGQGAASIQSLKRARSPSPPRSSIPSGYHRPNLITSTTGSSLAPLPSGSSYSGTKFSPYSTSTAVSSVSAASIYAHAAAAAAASQPGGYHYTSEAAIAAAAERVSKPIYLPQAELVRSAPIVSAPQRSSYGSSANMAVAVAAERQRAALAAQQPPSAHASIHRSNNLMSGYSRPGSGSAYPPPSTTTSSRIQPPPSQNGGSGVRYFPQREV